MTIQMTFRFQTTIQQRFESSSAIKPFTTLPS